MFVQVSPHLFYDVKMNTQCFITILETRWTFHIRIRKIMAEMLRQRYSGLSSLRETCATHAKQLLMENVMSDLKPLICIKGPSVTSSVGKRNG